MSEWANQAQLYTELPRLLYEGAKWAGKFSERAAPVVGLASDAYTVYRDWRGDPRPYRPYYVARPSWGQYNTKHGHLRRRGYKSRVKSYYRYRYLQQKYGNKYNQRYSQRFGIARPYWNR